MPVLIPLRGELLKVTASLLCPLLWTDNAASLCRRTCLSSQLQGKLQAEQAYELWHLILWQLGQRGAGLKVCSHRAQAQLLWTEEGTLSEVCARLQADGD